MMTLAEPAVIQLPPIILFIAGLVIMVLGTELLLRSATRMAALLGADVLVAGAVNMARAGGVSDAFIGLTVVAIGTSVPELVATMVATYRGDRDVAVGNLVGSSIYNILVILGVTLLASPKGIDVSTNQLWIDLPLAALVALVCMPVFKSDRSVSRAEGLAFLLAYVAYLAGLTWVRT